MTDMNALQAILLIAAVMIVLSGGTYLLERYQARFGKPLTKGRDQWNSRR